MTMEEYERGEQRAAITADMHRLHAVGIARARDAKDAAEQETRMDAGCAMLSVATMIEQSMPDRLIELYLAHLPLDVGEETNNLFSMLEN